MEVNVMKKTYIIPTTQVIQLDVHQPVLTMSLTDTETTIQFSREFELFPDDLHLFLDDSDFTMP